MSEAALTEVSLSFARSETCVLLGPSGSGKTTLLSILGCLLTPTEGDIEIDGELVPKTARDKLSELRRRKIGFVFQHSQLLGFLTVEENLRIVAENAGLTPAESKSRVSHLTTRLDISNYRHRKPAALSGGQRQRVAIARALIHRPSIVLADEPTAALDWSNGQIVIRLLIDQAKEANAALMVVTHDTRLVELFDRALHLDSGRMREP
ncbi:MAG: ABC transporter ATP-binding protein [Pirellulales bacterium]